MKYLDQCARWLLHSSLLWGAFMATGFYVSLHFGKSYVDPWLLNCLTGRWESYVCMSIFFVALAFLVVRMIDTAQEYLAMSRPVFKRQPNSNASAQELLDQFNQESAVRKAKLHTRLREALEFATQSKSGKTLEDHVRGLSDGDREQMNEKYGIVRFATWALPGIGSLGTVLGIAKAVSKMSSFESPELIPGVTAGLAEAFNTFALALALSIVLVFLRFVSEQWEHRLRVAIRKRIMQELKSCVNETGKSSLTQFDQMRLLAESVIQATEKLAMHSEYSQQNPAERANQDWLRPAELDERKMEKIVTKAMTNAFQQNPSVGMASSAGNTDLAGWQSLQQALQQVAQYLSRQQARQEGEGQVIEQLIQIIDEGSKDEHAPQFVSNRRRHVEEEPIALWK